MLVMHSHIQEEKKRIYLRFHFSNGDTKTCLYAKGDLENAREYLNTLAHAPALTINKDTIILMQHVRMLEILEPKDE